MCISYSKFQVFCDFTLDIPEIATNWADGMLWCDLEDNRNS